MGLCKLNSEAKSERIKPVHTKSPSTSITKRVIFLSFLALTQGCRINSSQEMESTTGTPGTIDQNFGVPGFVLASTLCTTDYKWSVAQQSTGKLISAGTNCEGSKKQFVLFRHTRDGIMDNSFVQSGMATISINDEVQAEAVAIQSDNKIVVAGSRKNGLFYDFAAARIKENGEIDTTFGTNGKAPIDASGDGSNDSASSIAVGPDGTIFIAGRNDQTSITTKGKLVALTANGSIENTFATAGIATFDATFKFNYFNSVLVTSDGTIFVGGSAGDVSENSDGNLPATPGSNHGALLMKYSSSGIEQGYTVVSDLNLSKPSEIRSIAIHAGMIIGVGYKNNGLNNDLAIYRFTSDLRKDTTFGTDGAVYTDINSGNEKITSVAMQGDGKIIVTGKHTPASSSDSRFFVARYNSNGSLDNTFGTNGIFIKNLVGKERDYGTSLTIQDDGKIVVAGPSYNGGIFNLTLMRLWP